RRGLPADGAAATAPAVTPRAAAVPRAVVEQVRGATPTSQTRAGSPPPGSRHVVLGLLAHVGPARFPGRDLAAAARASARAAGYRGRLTVGHDLMRTPLT
ncbi:hypothetical protein GA0115245_108814, partial [Streptomyces sp. di188]